MEDLPSDALLNERFMRLFVQHEMEILRAILVLVPHLADARDVLQETAVAMWNHFPAYDAERPFVNWGLGFARNHIRRYFRSVGRRQKLSEKAAEALLIAAEGQDEAAERRAEALAGCLEALPQPAKDLLEGYYFRQQTVDNLARQNAKSVEALYKKIQRLRLVLLDCIRNKLADPANIKPPAS